MIALIAPLAISSNLASGQSTAALAPGSNTFLDGNQLKAKFQKERAFANGYVAGIAGSVSQHSFEAFNACIPPNVTSDQAGNIVFKYLQQHPEQLRFHAPGVVAEALQNAFPCANK